MKRLFIFEMANNHMGDVNHGLLIINSFSKFIYEFGEYFEFAIKFQLRDIPTFIHREFINKDDHKYVKRFKETHLSKENFKKLYDAAKKVGFKVICTAFDEPSVDVINEFGFDYIKIASCSFTDWPLLNKIADSTNIPIIASCAGSSKTEIDNVVLFLTHRKKPLSLMHCVGEYPTSMEHLQLNQIAYLKNRYPYISVGYSTHESPKAESSIPCAILIGATTFEKHIGIETNVYKLNPYSTNVEEMRLCLQKSIEVIQMCGEVPDSRILANDKEQLDLLQFKRGVFLKHDANKGDVITRNDVYYAWPNIKDQVIANDMSKYLHIILTEDCKKDAPVLKPNAELHYLRNDVWEIVQSVKSFIKSTNVVYPGNSKLEISHHYGLNLFYQYGITMITIINRAYCKKLIVVLPGQVHPEQYHKQKEETFNILYGNLELYINDVKQTLTVGDVVTINVGDRHRFVSYAGCIIEELSSTHIVNDSYYTDEKITSNKDRKTIVNYWL